MPEMKLNTFNSMPIKRFYTATEARDFLGMNKNEWYRDAKPYLSEIKRGKQKSVYCFYELNALASKIKVARGRPAEKEIEQWDNLNQPDSTNQMAVESGTLIRSSKVPDFAKAAERIRSKKRSKSLSGK